jgi:hypothetical protein
MPNAKAEVMHRARVSDEELQLADGRPMLTLWWRNRSPYGEGLLEDIAADGLRIATEVTSCPLHPHSGNI